MTEPRSETTRSTPGAGAANQTDRATGRPEDKGEPAGTRSGGARKPLLFGQRFSEKEEKFSRKRNAEIE